MTADYQPVSCEFHDVLETLAIRRNPVVIVYRDEHGAHAEVRDRILDVSARGGEEFMALQGGLSLRLDRIVSVNGVALADF